MENISHHARLTAPEISALWTQYMNDSMAICVLAHSMTFVKDKAIYSVLKYALGLSQSHVKKIKEFLQNENYPIPMGFTKEDVNLDAPPLFSETLVMHYLYTMTLHGMNGYALSTGTAVRADQRTYFSQCSQESMVLYDKIQTVMLDKGIFSRPPGINPPQGIDFITEQSYMTGWFGKRRPLNGVEIGNIYYNMQKTSVKVVLEIAFSQVVRSKELREYFQRGANICNKHVEVFHSIFAKEDLPSPKKWTTEVTKSTEPPFSDKLMLYHILSLVSVAVGYYGTALSTCQRRDLMVEYTRLMMEMGKYAEDGANLFIKNGWMEQPPMTDDRDALARKK